MWTGERCGFDRGRKGTESVGRKKRRRWRRGREVRVWAEVFVGCEWCF